MILHLFFDDKFADYAIQQFQEIDNSSHFVVVLDNETEIKHIKQTDKIELVVFNSTEYHDLLMHLSAYSAIVVHGLFFPWQEQIILSAPENIKIAWVFWGGEIYSREELKKKYLSTLSKFILFLKKTKDLRKNLIHNTKKYFPNKGTFKRINYCLTDVEEDFDLVKSKFNPDMLALWYNYYSIEETTGELRFLQTNGKNILIGNSGTLENNHLNAFLKLRKFNLNHSKIIVPLSYGESWIIRLLEKIGSFLFKDKFLPLAQFIERNEYSKILLSCSIVIMPHYRPQAMGNILTTLWLGSKVYLSNRNPLSAYFKKLGIHIFSIENDLNPSNRKALLPLEKEKVEQNRKILLQQYGMENMLEKTKIIVNTLNE